MGWGRERREGKEENTEKSREKIAKGKLSLAPYCIVPVCIPQHKQTLESLVEQVQNPFVLTYLLMLLMQQATEQTLTR